MLFVRSKCEIVFFHAALKRRKGAALRRPRLGTRDKPRSTLKITFVVELLDRRVGRMVETMRSRASTGVVCGEVVPPVVEM